MKLNTGFRACAVASFLACAVVCSASAVTLVENGVAKAEVVLPADAWPVEKEAAKEFVFLVKKASGAVIPMAKPGIVREGFAHVLIGRAAGLAKSAPFAGRVVGNDRELRIAGGDGSGATRLDSTPCGTLFAVYEFAERELGAKFLWPDERYGIVTDSKSTIVVEGSYDYNPPFENVTIRALPVSWTRRAARACARRPNYANTKYGGHAFVDWWKRYGKEHPDFFEMVKGRRNVRAGASMCVANPVFHEEIVRIWREARAREPGKAFAINCCENDTKGGCTCPMCIAWNDPEADPKDASERYAHFYKAVYELAAKTDPSVRVYGYAYSNYVNPPRLLSLPENVFISFVPAPLLPYTAEARQKVLGDAVKWQQVGCTLSYRPNLYDGYAMPEDISTDYYAEFQTMRRGRMKSIDIDGPNKSFATQGPFLYILSRMMVHPEYSLERLKDEYYSAFGAAKGAVRDYWEFWNRYALDNADMFHEIPKKYNPLRHRIFFGFHYAFYAHRLFPDEVLAKGEPFLERAREAARNSPDDLARVEFLAAGLAHARLCSRACAVFADGKSTTEARLSVQKAVRDFRRDSLPAWAADVAYFTKHGKNEEVAWTFDTFNPERKLALPIEWRLMLDPEDAGAAKGYGEYAFDDSEWRMIDTDRHLEQQGIEEGYRNAWYRTKVQVPSKFIHQRCVVRLGAVDESCDLYVNGRKAGSFRYNQATDPGSWERPMEFDITEFIPSDGKIVIAVKVINEVRGGGLWRPSELRFFKPDKSAKERK